MRRRRRILLWLVTGAILNTLWRVYGDRVRAKVRVKLYGAPEAPDEDSVAYQLDQCVTDLSRGGVSSQTVAVDHEHGRVYILKDELEPFMPKGWRPWPRSVEQE